jgi:hypothetical protein
VRLFNTLMSILQLRIARLMAVFVIPLAAVLEPQTLLIQSKPQATTRDRVACK